MQSISKMILATSSTPSSRSFRLVLMLYLCSLLSGMEASGNSGTATIGPANTDTTAEEMAGDETYEMAPKYDCLTVDCGHQVVARAMPPMNQLVYSLLKELDTNGGFFGLPQGTGDSGLTLKSLPFPLALQMLLQQQRKHAATEQGANDLPLIITPIRKQRGNQLKMANRFGKRDRLRMSNRFGRK